MLLKNVLVAAKNFKELIGLIGFYILLIAPPLAPDLEVSYEKSDYFITDSSDNKSENVSKNKSILTLILGNKSKQRITDIEIEVRGVISVDVVGGRSSSIRMKNQINQLIDYDFQDNYRVFFKNIVDLPAGHNIQLQIIGDFLDLIIEDRINVTSNAKSKSITKMTKVTGLWVFLYYQSETLFAVVAILLIYYGVKRYYMEGSK